MASRLQLPPAISPVSSPSVRRRRDAQNGRALRCFCAAIAALVVAYNMWSSF